MCIGGGIDKRDNGYTEDYAREDLLNHGGE